MRLYSALERVILRVDSKNDSLYSNLLSHLFILTDSGLHFAIQKIIYKETRKKTRKISYNKYFHAFLVSLFINSFKEKNNKIEYEANLPEMA